MNTNFSNGTNYTNLATAVVAYFLTAEGAEGPQRVTEICKLDSKFWREKDYDRLALCTSLRTLWLKNHTFFARNLLKNCGVKPRYDASIYCGTRCTNAGKSWVKNR